VIRASWRGRSRAVLGATVAWLPRPVLLRAPFLDAIALGGTFVCGAVAAARSWDATRAPAPSRSGRPTSSEDAASLRMHESGGHRRTRKCRQRESVEERRRSQEREEAHRDVAPENSTASPATTARITASPNSCRGQLLRQR